MIPTEEQIEVFWTQRGFYKVTQKEVYDLGYFTLWENGKGYSEGKLPDIGLKSLFKWVMPLLDYPRVSFYFDDATWFCTLDCGKLRVAHKPLIHRSDRDPAYALYWAVCAL